MAENSAKGPFSGPAASEAGPTHLSPVFQESASGWLHAQRLTFVRTEYNGRERVVFSDSQGLYVREGNRRNYIESSTDMRRQMAAGAVAPPLPVNLADPLALLSSEGQIFDDHLKMRLLASAKGLASETDTPKQAFAAAAAGQDPAPVFQVPAKTPAPAEPLPEGLA